MARRQADPVSDRNPLASSCSIPAQTTIAMSAAMPSSENVITIRIGRDISRSFLLSAAREEVVRDDPLASILVTE